jgi:hypothetical protein
MPRVKNVEKRIWVVEEFDVVIMKDGRDVRGDRMLAKQYPYENKARGSHTVAEWKALRFAKAFEGYDVEVKLSNGETARGNTTLSNVRDSYIDDDE